MDTERPPKPDPIPCKYCGKPGRLLEPGRRPLLNPGSSYVNRDEEIRRMAEAYEERKHAVFLTPAQIKRLITALVDTSGGVDVGDHALYVALINVYERAGGV